MRALVARFWETPYKGKLVRWGTELHDRFMLPHFVWQDFLSIIDDLKLAGFHVAAEWFAPHFEFRFPLYGTIENVGLELELRQALEPWHVLGEEGVVGGTARYVDSSLERVQVRTARMTQDRYVITCNGRTLPLASTGVHGEFVAGVRFRAWQPASALHPTIPPHTPLIFDIVDTWTGRAIDGCRYHVAHPGGRAFDTFPVNAYEAESRRLTRFEALGHSPGSVRAGPAKINPEYPFTLDLRLSA